WPSPRCPPRGSTWRWPSPDCGYGSQRRDAHRSECAEPHHVACSVTVSRRELFERVDRPALMPLPTDRFEPAEWCKARVHEDYHVDVLRHWYSVPFELIGQEVEVRLTANMVEVYRNGL